MIEMPKSMTKKLMRAGVATAALLTFGTTGLIAQVPTLNPTVKVRARATAPAPAGCDESLAPQPAPRIEVTEIPVTERARTADLQPPPARGLRDQLAEAQAAVERHDRTAFNEWLALAKTTVAGYPPGGDRTAAAATIAVYDDVARLWDYQFASPTGAFFDATVQDGSLLAAMLRYPAYEQFIARQTLTDANGTRFYPTRETREFLARTAAQRLEKLGVRAAVAQRPPPETRVSPQPVPPPVRAGTVPIPSTRNSRAPEPAVRSTTGQRSASTSTTRQRRRPTRKTTTASSTTPTRSSSSGSPASSATSSRRTPTKRAAANPPVTRATAQAPDEIPIPSGVVSAPATATITPVEPPPVAPPSPASRTEITETTETVATSTAATTMTPATVPDPAPQPVQAPSRGRNLLFPLLLILIGVGVLILLFRASA